MTWDGQKHRLNASGDLPPETKYTVSAARPVSVTASQEKLIHFFSPL